MAKNPFSITVSKLELIFLVGLLLISSFLRLYRFRDTLMFLGDQGRDAIIAKNILKDGDIALIGPVTSVGNMYLGPFYYYFMVPWLALSYPDPIGPALAIAFIGILTVFLVYFITRKYFGILAAIFASALFATSTVVIQQTRFSWNPNLAPIVGLLIFWSVNQIITHKKHIHIIITSILFSLLIQLHYMGLVMAPFILLTIIYQFIKSKPDRLTIIKHSIVGLFIFLSSLLPLVLFDLRHDYTNLKAFQTFFTSPEEHLRPVAKLTRTLLDLQGKSHKVLTQTLGSSQFLSDEIILISLLICLFFILKKSPLKSNFTFTLLLSWLGITIVGISFYTSSVFNHYIAFVQPGVYILFGIVLSWLFSNLKIFGKITSLAFIIWLLIINLQHTPALAKAGSHIDTIKATSQSIYSHLEPDEKYNLVLISGTGDIDAQNFRYFLETTDHPPVTTADRGNIDTLFIIREDYFDTRVVDSPIYDIVVFPNKAPTDVYTIPEGPEVTILRRQIDE